MAKVDTLSFIPQDIPLTYFLLQARWAQLSFLVCLQCLSFPHSHCYISVRCRWSSAKVSLQIELRNVCDISSACRSRDSVLSTSHSWVPQSLYSGMSPKPLPREIWCEWGRREAESTLFPSFLRLFSSSLSHVFSQCDTNTAVEFDLYGTE